MRLFALLLLFLSSAQSFAFEEIRDILKHDERPAGVVIEITSDDELFLEKKLPELKADIIALRNKFKNLPIAIVSHYNESLILAKSKSKKHPALHKQIKDLSENTQTAVHVCGTFASWYNVEEDDFPDYVNVSPAGPTQVNDYVEMDYILVHLNN